VTNRDSYAKIESHSTRQTGC